MNNMEYTLCAAQGEQQSGSQDGYNRKIWRHTNKESKHSLGSFTIHKNTGVPQGVQLSNNNII